LNPREILEIFVVNEELRSFIMPIVYAILGVWGMTAIFIIIDSVKSFDNKFNGFLIGLTCSIIVIPGVFLYFFLKPDRGGDSPASFVQQCSRCRTRHFATSKFCYQCGNQMLKECESCHFFQDYSYRYCINCGSSFEVQKKAVNGSQKEKIPALTGAYISEEDNSFVPIIIKRLLSIE
jgi:hypothetical protein